MRDLPSFDRANHLFELGSERPEDKFAHYFRLRAHVLKGGKYGSIQLRLNNNAAPNTSDPNSPQLTDFCIKTDLEGIRKLGSLLFDFSKLKYRRLLWKPSESTLDNKLIDLNVRTGNNLLSAVESVNN